MTPRLIQHYLQLLRFYRRPLVKVVLGSILGIALFSYLLLLARPSYTASATVVVLPTSAEMAFVRQTSFGFDSTSTLSGTLLEYLVSRPILDRVLDQLKMGQNLGVEEEPETFGEHIAEAIKGLRSAVMKTLRLLNSGTYVKADPRASALDRLVDGVELSLMTGTMVFEIEVTLPDPDDAATAANALAASYLEGERQELDRTADELEAFLDAEIAARSAKLEALRIEEVEKRRELGLESLEGEADILLSSRETERENQVAARIRRVALEAQIRGLVIERADARSGEALRRIEQEISGSRASLEALKQGEEIRKQTLASISAKLDSLHEREQPIAEILRRIMVVENDIKGLREELYDINLSRAVTANRVRIVNPAVVPVYPSFPLVLINVILGSIAVVFLALVAVVVTDTFSGTVKTAEDLRTLSVVSLGTLPAGVSEWESSSKRGERRRWEGLRDSLLEDLALLGMLDGERVRLTGFVSEEELAVHGRLLEAGLAAPTRGDFLDEETDASSSPSVEVELLKAIGEGFRWTQVKAGDSVLCLVPAGCVSEDQVKEFADRTASLEASVGFLVLGG